MSAGIEVTSTGGDGSDVWPVQRAVFDDHPDIHAWRSAVWEGHSTRPGFRLARAHGERGLAGFAYGYTGERGQWWTDTVATVLGPSVSDAWLGGHFEVVTLAVLEEQRGRGVGRALLRALLDGLPHERLLLMTTSDPADPARRLYATEGWDVLGPGTREGTVVMGRRAGR